LKPQQTKKVKPKAAPQPGFGRAYARLAFSLLNPHMGRLYKRFGGLEEQVRRSGIRLTYKSYLCRAVLTTIIVGVVGLGFSALIAAILPISTVSKIAIPLAIGLGGGGLSFVIQLFQPRFKLGGRRRRIDEDLAFVVGRMAVLSASGMTPENIMREVASDDSKDVLTGEFRKMVRDMNLLGMDLTGALAAERLRSPSELFNAFLDGMMSTASSGADVQEYLIKQSKTLMADKRLKAKSISESLGVVAEMYTTVLVVMPLILIILFAVMGVIAGSLGGVSISVLMDLVVYVMVPLGGVMIMVIADGIVPKR
jgi:flagellar protein FlaJ